MRLNGASHLAVALAAALTLAGSAPAQLTDFFEDFESLDRTDPGILGATGWMFFAEGINGDALFPNFTFFDPNVTPPNNIDSPNITVISDVPSGGDPPAGDQGLVVFTDTVSDLFTDTADGVDDDPRDLVLSIFQQQDITSADIGSTVTFSWLAEENEFSPTGDALTEAFLLTLDPNNGFIATNDLAFDTTNTPDTPTANSLTLDLTDPALAGQILQFGFRVTASDLEDSAVDYDNVSLVVSGGGPDGDFNGDGVVTAADFATFRDGDSPNGPVSGDFDLFAANFDAGGTSFAAAAATAVPEPSGLLLLIAGVGAAAFRRR